MWAARAGHSVILAVKARRGAHTVYRLAYHLVWIPQYRRKVLKGDVAERLETLICEICATGAWEIEALTVQIPRFADIFLAY